MDQAPFPATHLAAGSAIYGGPWLAAWLASPPSIGFGDIKLSAGLGLYLGWLGPPVALAGFVVACVVAAAAAAAAATRGRSTTLPFGPALVAGAVLAGLAEATTGGRGPLSP